MPDIEVDWARVIIVVLILASAIAANIYANRLPPEDAAAFPYIGATVFGVLLLLTPWRRPDWKVVPGAAKGSVFLLSLVLLASMMPVERTAGGHRPKLPWGWASCPRCSTTFRSPSSRWSRAAMTGARSPTRWDSAAR